MNSRISENKIVLVKRKTRLEELIVRYNTIQQAQFYIERLGVDFTDYIQEDQNYRHAVEQSMLVLQTIGRVQLLEREHVPNFIFGEDDIVVVLGQDGLVANTMKYVTHQPLIGVNPDPLRWDGILLPFQVRDLIQVVPDVLNRRRAIQEVMLAKAELNDGQTLYGVNDLFIGRKTHVSARYQLQLAGHTEQQSSSGIIVSTGMGATGWFKSVLAGANGIVHSESYQQITGSMQYEETHSFTYTSLAWDTPQLYFTVREPFPSRTTSTECVFGQIHEQQPLRIVSQMPENGVIFSDGVESDFLEFNSGMTATIGLAEKRGHLVV